MRHTMEKPPMRRMLEAMADTVRFHMPGHKGSLDPWDVTELSVTDDLYAPAGAIAEAEAMAADSCGAEHTLMLTGGSTAGLLTMILSTVSPGEKLILPRDVHHAVVSACIWGDIRAVFTCDVVQALDQNPDAKAVLVTRPDYYGRCMDLGALAALAHAKGVLVLVDEAHGAHFSWWDTPLGAAKLGADAWVQSAHKTLPALTGAAWLHVANTADHRRARHFLRMVQTSSPPFPILLSLDDARAWMDAHGEEALAALCKRLLVFRRELQGVGGYADVPSDDPTRLVIGTQGHGYAGQEIHDALARQRIHVEMADDDAVVCICTVADTPEMLLRLREGLAKIPRRQAIPPSVQERADADGERVMGLREAALSAQEVVPLREAPGRIASASAGLYPPGIPLVLPGERVTECCVRRLCAHAPERRFGLQDDGMICVK